MLKKIISVFGVLFIVGCTNNETGLEKKVLNTALNDCQDRLQQILKSPSSLRLGKVDAATYPAKAEDVFIVDSQLLLDNEGKIQGVQERLKVRYRELGVSIPYEAQNSFGVFLANTFSCSYIYQLHQDEKSPENDILLSQIRNGDEIKEISDINISLKNKSNFFLDSKFDKIIGDATHEQTKEDIVLLKEVKEIWSTKKTFSDIASGTAVDAAPE